MNQCGKVCFIGLGYVGLPTAVIVATSGDYEVVGVDIDSLRVEMANNGHVHFYEPGLEEILQNALSNKVFKATTKPEKSDVYVIVVPTPVDSTLKPDVTMVKEAVSSIIPMLGPGNLVVIESTCPVGTTESVIEQIFRKRPELRDNIYVAYCPERILPGNIVHELIYNDRVIGGYDEKSTEKAISFYSSFVKGEMYGTTPRTAELCKLTENSYRDVQVAFANELSMISESAGVDVWKLINLANKHPRVNILRPGCGVGGHCIAVDPYFILSEYPEESKLIYTGRNVNKRKAEWVIEQVSRTVCEYSEKSGKSPVVALMGLTYKPNIGDLRESPSLYIARNLIRKFKEIKFHIAEPNLKEHPDIILIDYRDAYEKSDIVVFLTPHSQFFNIPFSNEKIILDYCGIFADIKN